MITIPSPCAPIFFLTECILVHVHLCTWVCLRFNLSIHVSPYMCTCVCLCVCMHMWIILCVWVYVCLKTSPWRNIHLTDLISFQTLRSDAVFLPLRVRHINHKLVYWGSHISSPYTELNGNVQWRRANNWRPQSAASAKHTNFYTKLIYKGNYINMCTVSLLHASL